MSKNFDEIETLKPMACGAITDPSLRMIYEAIRGALKADNSRQAAKIQNSESGRRPNGSGMPAILRRRC